MKVFVGTQPIGFSLSCLLSKVIQRRPSHGRNSRTSQTCTCLYGKGVKRDGKIQGVERIEKLSAKVMVKARKQRGHVKQTQRSC